MAADLVGCQEAEGRSAASQARFHTAVASLKSASAAEQRLQATRSSKILLVECVAEYARTQFALVAALASPALAEKMRKPLEQKLRAVQKRYSPPPPFCKPHPLSPHKKSRSDRLP